ncbi:tail fiber protein [Vibrio rhizosphaerae]|uniref:Tail fiber protein n=1 Tax=Vibrio rhizosphaerae TaxID=398736 RepID=A0ABU4J110_9VIBR|nr:tail fiber protein [Vibrio rhizosphaerae]MDW6094204.1 tail fiber protein [Vibrio rhizosphaerae]
MSQVAIPFAFESYLQDRLLNGLAPDMNEVIFAYLPDLDPEQVIDRNLGLPAPTYWVYRQDVTQKAKLNDDSVAYSVVIPSEVETFTFNAIYLHDKQTADSCGLVVHKTAETKEPGMSSVRTCVQQYTGAARAAKINVTPESWQIDYHARLYGMDDDLRLACFELFGPASFFADGFMVQSDDSQYFCTAGTGYVAGLRCVNQQQVQLPDAQAGSKIYLDVSWQGQVVSRWATRWTLVVSATSITDYTEDGIQHYVAPIAQIEADGRVTDLRHLGLDENKLPDATITTKGAVIRATDIDVLNGRGSDILSAEQLKAAMSQFGLFGSAYNLGDVVEHSAFDSAPHGLIAFTSRLPLNNDINVAWQGVKSIDGPAYTIIAASNNAGDPKLVFYHSTRNQWYSVLTDVSDATTDAKGAVVLATDHEANTGQGTGVLSARQLKQALGQFGSFGKAIDLGVIENNAEFDSVPTGLLHFASSLISGTQTEYQGIKVQHPSGDYSVIAGGYHAGNNTLVMYHSLGKKWTEVLMADRADIIYPVGAPQPWPLTEPPSGWLECRGQSFNRSAYPLLAKAYPQGVLPDLRGEFIRGWDHGRGADAGRHILSGQGDQFRSHTHGGVPQRRGDVDRGGGSSLFSIDDISSTLPVGGNETRPRNIAFMYIVRAA